MVNKPIAAVVFEGTIVNADVDLNVIGNWTVGIRDKLKELQETHTVLIVSAFARTDGGVRRLQSLMYQESIPFDDIWCGYGIPVCDKLYDNRAEKL